MSTPAFPESTSKNDWDRERRSKEGRTDGQKQSARIQPHRTGSWRDAVAVPDGWISDNPRKQRRREERRREKQEEKLKTCRRLITQSVKSCLIGRGMLPVGHPCVFGQPRAPTSQCVVFCTLQGATKCPTEGLACERRTLGAFLFDKQTSTIVIEENPDLARPVAIPIPTFPSVFRVVADITASGEIISDRLFLSASKIRLTYRTPQD